MNCAARPAITATPRWPGACSWRPSMDLPDDERRRFRGAIAAARDEIEKQRVVIAALHKLVGWSMGDGPLPCDEEAEEACRWWYSVYLNDELPAIPLLTAAFLRMEVLMVGELYELPTESLWSNKPILPWYQVVCRLARAHDMRRSLFYAKDAIRRLLQGNERAAGDDLLSARLVLGLDRGNALARVEWPAEDALAAWIRSTTTQLQNRAV